MNAPQIKEDTKSVMQARLKAYRAETLRILQERQMWALDIERTIEGIK